MSKIKIVLVFLLCFGLYKGYVAFSEFEIGVSNRVAEKEEKAEIERQGDDKELGGLDEHTSGKYLILHLCHHFDTERSFTSMTLARDTYGLHIKDEGNSNEQLKKESGLLFN